MGQVAALPLVATSGGSAHRDLRPLNPQQRKYDALTSGIGRTADAR